MLPASTKEGLKRNIIDRAVDDSIGTGDYSSGRFEMWSTCLKLFYHNPIVGTGWQTINAMAGQNSHSEFFLYLATTGLVGFTLYYLIFYRLFTTVLFFRRKSKSLCLYYDSYLAGMISFITAALFVNIYNPYIFFFIYSGLILKMGSIEEQLSVAESDLGSELV